MRGNTSEIESLCAHFLTLRDEAIFRLTLEGFGIDEVLSMRLSDYNSVKRLIQPSRSKMRQTAPINGENRLRKIRTHSGRSTKVMELLENGALNPAERKSEAELLYHFGWKSINSMQPYMKFNSEIMANTAFDRHNKSGDGDD